MFLQNLYVWKPFRAVAAAMLVLVMATACQETAQQVIQPSANVPVAQSEATQEKVTLAQNTSLTSEERALAKKVATDKDFLALREMHKTLVFKMKIAMGHDKEKFKQAVVKNDVKTFAELMNFSEPEYLEFSAKYQQSMNNNIEHRY